MEDDDDDRISSLPDEILCHILSFVETKEACATRVLSKRWKSVWQWSTSLTADFDDACYTNSEESYRLFLVYLYKAFTAIYPHKPMKKFRLCCRSSEFFDPQALSDCLYMSALRGLEHLDLSLAFPNYLLSTDLSPIFRCTTLVVLKLHGFHDLQPFPNPNPSSVHFPLLQVLHLQDLIFPGRQSLADLLSASPNLQDLKVTGLRFENYVTDRDFKTSPKLLRADISATHTCFLFTEVVNNVQFLRLDRIYCRLLYEPQWMYHCNSFPMFHNLIHLQLVYQRYNAHWSQVLELLHHCPKLQLLAINQPDIHSFHFEQIQKGELQLPPSVPQCLLLHLKRCYLIDYRGTKPEFEFARYIMHNGRFLKSMTISTGIAKNPKFKMLKELSSCKRGSATCRLCFK